MSNVIVLILLTAVTPTPVAALRCKSTALILSSTRRAYRSPYGHGAPIVSELRRMWQVTHDQVTSSLYTRLQILINEIPETTILPQPFSASLLSGHPNICLTYILVLSHPNPQGRDFSFKIGDSTWSEVCSLLVTMSHVNRLNRELDSKHRPLRVVC